MALPGVKIELKNGGLGQAPQTKDGIAGIILTGKAVTGKLELNKAYQLLSLEDAEDLGIESKGDNAFAYGQIAKFYTYASAGSPLWMMLVDAAVSMEQACDKEGDYAPALEIASGNEIKLLAVSTKAAKAPTPKGGLAQDVSAAAIKAQALAEKYTRVYSPFRVILDGKNFSGKPGDLTDYKGDNKNRVCIFLCNENKDSRNADVGTLLGLAASLPVQRNIGRVKNGPLQAKALYLTDGKSVEEYQGALESIHDKAYITCRAYAGKSGYFFTDDPMLTSNTDDYNSLARGRVIDKAIQLTYKTYVTELLDEIPMEKDGTINPAVVKSWQAMVENAINLTMTANGEISAVKAYIDAGQKVLSTNKLEINLKILPIAYNKFIEVSLGFSTNL